MRPSYGNAIGAVYAGQLGRARVARVSLLFVAAFQSLGILVLLRGIVDTGRLADARQIVAGASVLVVAFVALNLLAQRFGLLRSLRALDYYAALPVPRSAVVLGTAASYATFAAPGCVVVAVFGALLYRLPLAHVWLVLPVLVVAGAALAGLGALLGLLAPRPELATVLGQLGMTLVLFLGLIRAGRLPVGIRVLRAVLPSTYAVDALREALTSAPRYGRVVVSLGVCAAFGAVALLAAVGVFRRAVSR
jgi:ABC-2 type transport system permease protein